MIQPLQVIINNYEYKTLRDFTLYYMRWTKSHYKTSKANGIPPEPIVGIMFEKYFKKRVDEIIISRKGKKFNFHYYEGKAIYDVMAIYPDIGIISIRAKFDKALTDWVACPATLTFQQWYNNNPIMIDTFGVFEELDEYKYELAIMYFNRETSSPF